MNLWFLVSLIPPIFWGVANVIDAVARRHFVKNDLALTWFIAVTRLPVVLALIMIFGFHVAPLVPTLFMLLSGVLWMVPFVLYYKAMEFEEPSIVILILQAMPVFIYIIAYFLLDERLTMSQWGGFALLLIGGMLAAVKRLQNSWHISKALWIMLTAGVLWAFADVLFKQYVSFFVTFWDAMTVYLFGGAACGIVIGLFFGGNRKMAHNFSHLNPRGWSFIIINQLIGLTGTFALSYAFVLGKASLTSVISGLQPLVAFAAAIPLSMFIPEVMREGTDRTSLALKGSAFIMTIGGLVFLYYNA